MIPIGHGVIPSDPQPEEVPGSPQLRWWNVLNLVAYLLNLGVTYASLTGIFGGTNSDLSRKYQTLVTPAGFAFSIWGPIFVWEAAFAVAQMLVRFRAAKVVLLATPWWIGVCVFQILWTLVFAQEVIWLALICMLMILTGLVGIGVVTDGMPMSTLEFWLIRSPFSLHLGWIIAATVVNINVLADQSRASTEELLALAMAGFAAVVVIATTYAFVARSPDFIVCFVAAWAFLGIRSELGDPTALNAEDRFNPHRWDSVTLGGLRAAATAISLYAFVLGIVAAARRVLALYRERRSGGGGGAGAAANAVAEKDRA